MESLALLVSHLVGDFLLQGDWQAANKSNPHPGPKPPWPAVGSVPAEVEATLAVQQALWQEARQHWHKGHLACALHCTLYTLAVWSFTVLWMPWWGVVSIWASHFVIDRWRLARVLMRWKHEKFATGPLSPWSIVAVDQTLHLLVLYVVGALTGR